VFNLKDTFNTSMQSAWTVIKLIIPLYILSDLLLYFNLLDYVSFLFEPITEILSLPKEAAVGIAAGMLFNLYSAIAFLAPLDMNAFQWTIIATFLGIAHSLIIENTIMKKIGIPHLYSLLLRVSVAFIAIIPLYYLPKYFFIDIASKGEEVAKVSYTNILDLLTGSFYNASILSIKVITLVTIIIFLMDLLKSTKQLKHYQKNANRLFSIIAGLILGIIYGAGILINEAKSGNLSKVDIFYISTFLMICHSIIEDVLLFVIFGANGFIVLIVRLVMAIVLSYILVVIYKKYIIPSKII